VTVTTPRPANSGVIAAAFDYRNEQGELLYQVVRFEPAGSTKRRPDGNGDWSYELGDVRQVLYRLADLVAAEPNAPVFLVEDERDADRLVTRELVATTNPGGADVTKTGKPGKGNWRPEFNPFFRDRRVAIIPCNHDAGREHAWKVAEQILPFATQVRIVELPGVRPGGGVSDFFSNGGNREQLLELVEKVSPLTKLMIEFRKSQQTLPNTVSGGMAFGSISGKKTQADLLLDLALDGGTTELFHDNDIAFATVKVDDHSETMKLASSRFRLHLRQLFYGAQQAGCGNQAVETAINTLSAMAMYNGAQKTVHLRVAVDGRAIYVDICDERWRAIEITSDGWRVISDPPVKFRRTRGMKPLPEPIRGGSIDELRPYLNPGTDDQFKLAVSWLVVAIAGRAPFPVLILHGEEGTAKSTAAAILRRLCDPNFAPLRADPREKGDLIIAANNGHIIAFDNLSHMPPWLSDAICRLATGSGFSRRQLWTDEDEALFQARKPVILNGIEELATQADLLDRSLILNLPAIRDTDRRTEDEFWAAFEAARPRILGALLDAISMGLRRISQVKFERLPRMADFTKFMTSAEPGLGWAEGSFMAAYERNREEANLLALEASVVATVIRAIDLTQPWAGTATELLARLDENVDETKRRSRHWPKTPRALTNALRRTTSNLRRAGIEVDLGDRATTRDRSRLVKLRRTMEDKKAGDTSAHFTPTDTTPGGLNGRSGRNKT